MGFGLMQSEHDFSSKSAALVYHGPSMSTFLSLEPGADLESLPWDCLNPIGLPATSFGRPVEWRPDYLPQPVFIGRCVLPDGGELLMFGVRYDFQWRTEPAPGDGYFVRYVVVQQTLDGPVAHVLAQHRSTTYQSLEETRDSVFGSDIKKKDLPALCSGEPPRWKAGEAQWPLLSGLPMQFVTQFALPENEVTRQWLTFNESIFLFWRETEGRAVSNLPHRRPASNRPKITIEPRRVA